MTYAWRSGGDCRCRMPVRLGLWGRLLLLAGALTLLAGWVTQLTPRVFLVGDSTMSDKPLVGSPERGWGQVFPLFLRDGVVVENHARNGRSTRSFILEGRWDSVMARLRTDDYVMIQFGHNDAKRADTNRYADAQTDFRANLTRFIRDTRSKGAQPVLITPVVRRRFDADGLFYDVHGDYPTVVREVGARQNVPVIDLHARSMDLLERLGPDSSKPLFLHFGPRDFSAFPEGRQDDTHFTWFGATEVARLVTENLAPSSLARWIEPDGPPPFPGMGKTVLLDNYYNNDSCKHNDYAFTHTDKYRLNSGISNL